MRPDYQDIPIAGGDTAKPLTLRKRLRLINRYLVPGRTRFLDCGCGAGDYVFQLIDTFGLDAYGIEYDGDKVLRAREHTVHGHRVTQGDVQALESKSEDWDYAMLNEVLEHVPAEHAALREVYRVLKVDGLLFVFAPNRWFPFETHGVYLKKSGRGVPPWFPFVPYVPVDLGNRFLKYWARNYGQRELRKLVTSVGFEIVATAFVWQTFEGISGQQPTLVKLLKPILRKLANFLESVPFITRLGVSQVLICRKA